MAGMNDDEWSDIVYQADLLNDALTEAPFGAELADTNPTAFSQYGKASDVYFYGEENKLFLETETRPILILDKSWDYKGALWRLNHFRLLIPLR